MHNPNPRALPWGDRGTTGHGLRPGPLVAPAQHPRLYFHWKRTPARLGRKQESHQDFLDFRIYPKPVPRDLSQDFSTFPDRIPVGFYPWSRSYLGPAYARIAEASTAYRSLQRARIREDVCLPRLCQTPPGGPDRVFLTPRPSRGIVSSVALGLPGHPPKGGCPTLPPEGGVT